MWPRCEEAGLMRGACPFCLIKCTSCSAPGLSQTLVVNRCIYIFKQTSLEAELRPVSGELSKSQTSPPSLLLSSPLPSVAGRPASAGRARSLVRGSGQSGAGEPCGKHRRVHVPHVHRKARRQRAAVSDMFSSISCVCVCLSYGCAGR